MVEFQWDVFISHASEDKATIVVPIVAELEKYGLRVWFDATTLRVGDSLRRSIDTGLAKSRFGVVVLSPAFFSKGWPQSELDGLFARQVEGEKVILPIWHEISKNYLLEAAPMLVDMRAARTEDGVQSVARQLVAVIRPEALELDTSRADAHRVNARLLDQLKENNPQFDFRLSVSPDMKPDVTGLPARRGTIASFSEGGMQIDVSPHDVKEYLKNPIRFSISFRNEGIAKALEMIKTGKAQEFAAGEFGGSMPHTELVGLPKIELGGGKLFFTPSYRNLPPRPVRVTFGKGPETLTYQFMELRIQGMGTAEISFVVGATNVPFQLRVVVRKPELPGSHFEIVSLIKGADVHSVQKYFKAMSCLSKSGELEVASLETEQIILSSKCAIDGPGGPAELESYSRLADDVVLVSDAFGLKARWPETFSEADLEHLGFLKSVVNGEPFADRMQFTSVLVKTDDNKDVLERFQPGATMAIPVGPMELFGIAIEAKHFASLIDEISMKEARETKERFATAKNGDRVEIVCESISGVRGSLWDPETRMCVKYLPSSEGTS